MSTKKKRKNFPKKKRQVRGRKNLRQTPNKNLQFSVGNSGTSGNPKVHEYTFDDFDTRSDKVMRQIQIVEHTVPPSLPGFMSLSRTIPLLCVSKGVALGETVEISPGQFVGIHWIAAYTYFYDLWLAASGSKSIFTTNIEQYWEMRQAITPTKRGANSYRFEVPDSISNWLGGPGFVLVFNDSSLSWVVDPSTPRATMNTVTPSVSLDVLSTVGVSAVERILLGYGNHTNNVKIIEQPDETGYDMSIAAFAIPEDSGFPGAPNWTTFTHEEEVHGWEEWVGMLGLTDFAPDTLRRGPHKFAGLRTSAYFGDRLMRQITGRQRAVILRPKYYSFPAYLVSIVTAFLRADMFRSDLASDEIEQDDDESLFALIQGCEFLYTIYSVIANRFSTHSFLFSDCKPRSDFQVIGSGVTQVPDYTTLQVQIPMFIVEALASVAPFRTEFSRAEHDEIYYPVLILQGSKTRVNIFENFNAGDDDDLASLIEYAWPPSLGSAPLYKFKTSVSLPGTLDFSDFTYSSVAGAAFPDAIDNFAYMSTSLQGNIQVAASTSNDHIDETLNYYTVFVEYPNTVDSFSKCHESFISRFTNRFGFQPSVVGPQLSRNLPIAPINNEDVYYVTANMAIGGDICSLIIDADENWAHRLTQLAFLYAHEVAGEGTESGLLNTSALLQGKGGGFMGFLRSVGESILPIAANVVGGLLKKGVPRFKRTNLRNGRQVIKFSADNMHLLHDALKMYSRQNNLQYSGNLKIPTRPRRNTKNSKFSESEDELILVSKKQLKELSLGDLVPLTKKVSAN